MEIKQLEYVIMSADMGSFNKASEFLYTTQSNVSKVIRKLERELGYEIFRRQGNGVALTDAGKLFYEQAQQILKMLRRIEDFKELSHKTCLHIASVVSNFVATHFAQFVIDHNESDYCLKMWEGSITDIIELVECGEAEPGFAYIGEQQYSSFQTYLQRKGLYFSKILPAQVEVCIGRNNPLGPKTEVRAEELKNLKFVSLLEDAISKNYHLHQLEQKLHLEKNMADAIQVEFIYSSDIKDYKDEMSFVDSAKKEDCEGIISFITNDLSEIVKYCAKKDMYYMLGSGTQSSDEFDMVKNEENFLGIIGPSVENESEAGQKMIESLNGENGSEKTYVLLSGGSAFNNFMHKQRLCAMLETLQKEEGFVFEQSFDEIASVQENTLAGTTKNGGKVYVCPGYLNLDKYAGNLKNVLSEAGEVDVVASTYYVSPFFVKKLEQ